MSKGLVAAAAVGALLIAGPAQASTGTYAGTVGGTGQFAMDVKINKFNIITKVKELRGKAIPTHCEISGAQVANHTLPTNLSVKTSNGKFGGSFTQPTYGNVSTISGKIKHKHVSGTLKINYHYAAEGELPEENCDTGPLQFNAKLGAPDGTETTPPARLSR